MVVVVLFCLQIKLLSTAPILILWNLNMLTNYRLTFSMQPGTLYVLTTSASVVCVQVNYDVQFSRFLKL